MQRGRLAALVLSLSALRAEAGGVRRLGVFIGNDRGGEGTRPLRHAEDDAHRMFDLFVRLGGVLPEDAQLLLGRDAAAARKALEVAERKAAQAQSAGDKVVLVLFFSGHGKEGALRLGDSALPMAEVRERLAKSPIDVRVAIVDACRSGALTRTKGARLAPAFELDDGARLGARGMVLLASSSEHEEAHESAELRGSYFTHHFASALLGSGDASGDGRVTLSEAYAHAYARTVAETSASASGVQHPTFSFDLEGSGDLVLTDLQARREGVVVPATAPEGTYWVVDDQGAIAAEVDKRGSRAVRIALAPGAYLVRRRLEDRLRLGSVDVRPGQLAVVEESGLRDAPFSDDPVKGEVLEQALSTRPLVGVELGGGTWLRQPAGLFATAPALGLRLDLQRAFSGTVGLAFGLGFASARSTLPIGATALPFQYTALQAHADVLAEPWSGAGWSPYLAGRLTWMTMLRRFDDPSLPVQFHTTFVPGAGLGLHRMLGRSWVVAAELGCHTFWYALGPTQTLVVQGAVELRIAWGPET